MSIDPDLSRLYRAGATEEPPRTLDEAVLAAARRELPRAGAGRKPRASFNWQVPFALAAVLTLTVSLVLVSGDDAGQPRALFAPDAELFEQRSSPSPGTSSPTEGSPPTLPKPEAPIHELRRDRSTAEQAAARSGPSASTAPPPAPDRVPLRPQREGGAERAPSAAPVPQAVQVPERLEKEDSSIATPEEPASQPPRAFGKLRLRPRAGADAAEPAGRAKRESDDPRPGLEAHPAAHAKPASPASQSAQSAQRAADEGEAAPEELLREIEQLRRDGRLDEARVRLEAFRRRFPSYPLPPALQ